MRAHQLVVRFREYQVADLWSSINAIEWSQVQCVPESDALVSRATTCGQETSMKWAPVDSFDSSLMVGESL